MTSQNNEENIEEPRWKPSWFDILKIVGFGILIILGAFGWANLK